MVVGQLHCPTATTAQQNLNGTFAISGALYGIGLALALGVAYWMLFAIFMKFGEVGNLPPLLAAWAANILFALAAVYMFLTVET
jgi:lipopolysaccharide export system permease protein